MFQITATQQRKLYQPFPIHHLSLHRNRANQGLAGLAEICRFVYGNRKLPRTTMKKCVVEPEVAKAGSLRKPDLPQNVLKALLTAQGIERWLDLECCYKV